MRLNILPVLMAAGLIASTAPRASAETILTPFAGIVFSGDTTDQHGVYGGSLAFTAATGLGFEIDFAYSPDFFGADRLLVPENNMTTLMGNLMFSGRLSDNSRIYGSAGGGLLKPRVDDTDDFFDVDRTDFGVNAGGGVILGVSDCVGIRADVRYFRTIGDDEPDNEFDIDFGNFSYWRATGGLAFTF